MDKVPPEDGVERARLVAEVGRLHELAEELERVEEASGYRIAELLALLGARDG
jgi:hypothetical protein